MKTTKIFLFFLITLLISQIPFVTAGNLLIRLSFDGTDDYVEVANSASLNFTGGSFSAEIWARVTNPATGTPYMFISHDIIWENYWGLQFQEATEKIIWFVGDDVNEININYVFANYDNGEWHHYVGTFNNTNNMGMLYIDGSYVLNHSIAVGDFDHNESVYIGYDPLDADAPYRGQYDEARIYNRTLTPTEITYSHNNIEPQSQTGLVMWLRMNEGSGTTAYDETANNNDGTLNGPTWIDEEYTISDYTGSAGLVLATMFGLFALVLGFMVVARPQGITIKEVMAYLIIICVLMIFVTIFTGLGG